MGFIDAANTVDAYSANNTNTAGCWVGSDAATAELLIPILILPDAADATDAASTVDANTAANTHTAGWILLMLLLLILLCRFC